MTHLTEETILAVRDREPVADEVLSHISECAVCARALEDARARVERALAVLTMPVGVNRFQPPCESGGWRRTNPVRLRRRNPAGRRCFPSAAGGGMRAGTFHP